MIFFNHSQLNSTLGEMHSEINSFKNVFYRSEKCSKTGLQSRIKPKINAYSLHNSLITVSFM